MASNCANSNEPALFDALRLLQEGLSLLDQDDAPADIGAHIDLAIFRLEAHLSTGVRGHG